MPHLNATPGRPLTADLFPTAVRRQSGHGAALLAGFLRNERLTLSPSSYLSFSFSADGHRQACLTAPAPTQRSLFPSITLTTLTLMCRPVGGRSSWTDAASLRPPLPLMIEPCLLLRGRRVLTGCAIVFTNLLVLRALFGIGMVRRVGSWVAFSCQEKCSARLRGVLSGLLQQGNLKIKLSRLPSGGRLLLLRLSPLGMASHVFSLEEECPHCFGLFSVRFRVKIRVWQKTLVKLAEQPGARACFPTGNYFSI